MFIRRRQSSDSYGRLLGPVSDHVLKNRASKGRALHQVIKYSPDTVKQIVEQLTQTTKFYIEISSITVY